jgi:hypothetical protein
MKVENEICRKFFFSRFSSLMTTKSVKKNKNNNNNNNNNNNKKQEQEKKEKAESELYPNLEQLGLGLGEGAKDIIARVFPTTKSWQAACKSARKRQDRGLPLIGSDEAQHGHVAADDVKSRVKRDDVASVTSKLAAFSRITVGGLQDTLNALESVVVRKKFFFFFFFFFSASFGKSWLLAIRCAFFDSVLLRVFCGFD